MKGYSPVTDPINYKCFISFPCPVCGAVISPTDYAFSVLASNLEGISLENGLSLGEAYRLGVVDKSTVDSILTKDFECLLGHSRVHPAGLDEVALVGG